MHLTLITSDMIKISTKNSIASGLLHVANAVFFLLIAKQVIISQSVNAVGEDARGNKHVVSFEFLSREMKFITTRN